MTELQADPLTPRITLALVIDGVVQQVLNADARTGAILLSNPTIVDATELFEEEYLSSEPQKKILTGNTYDLETNTFTFVDNSQEVLVFPL